MNKIYKFSLAIIILIFIFLESSELRRISYSRDTVYFSNLNNTVLLEKSLNSDNKKYLTDELADIHKIEEVSRKFKKTEPDSESQELEIRTKTSSGKASIFTEAFQVMTTRGIYSPSRGYTFNFQDPISGKYIRPSLMLEAHLTCQDEMLKLPRMIEKKDKVI